jgi:hypothetical protein
MLQTFLPRSKISLTIMAGMILTGIALPRLVEWVADEKHEWLMQYMCACMLLMLGVALGNTLGAMRGWAAVQLVPGLMATHVRIAILSITGVWLFYISFIIALDQTNGFPLSITLACGLAGLMLGSGVHKKLSIPLIIILTLLTSIPEIQAFFLQFFRTGWGELSCVTASVLCTVELIREYRRPPSEKDTSSYEKLLRRGTGQALVTRPRLMSALRIGEMNQTTAFRTSIEHTWLQAWLNDGINFLGLNAIILIPLLLYWSAKLSDVFSVIMILSSILIISSPLLLRNALMDNLEFHWLTGRHSSRRALLEKGFLTLMLSALRICTLALILIGIFSLSSAESATFPFAPSLVICSVGAAALMLATVMVMHANLNRITNPYTLLCACLLVLELGLSVWISMQFAMQFSYGLAIVLSVAYAILCVLGSTFVAANWTGASLRTS